jgi:predicted PurR-regulated permease PerM
MKLLRDLNADAAETQPLRTIAFTLAGAAAMAALYFGQEVLLPTAVAILIAFIVSPATSRLHRLMPLSLSVATTVLIAVAVVGLVAMLVMSQLAEVAGSLTGYQMNLQQKVKDLHALSEGSGPLSRFTAMIASLMNDITAREGARLEPAVQVQPSTSNFAAVAAFVFPLLHPLLTIGIVLILVVFILLDRDHISDQVVRLLGGSNVHATSEALEDAAGRVARVLSLQVLTNFGFSIAIGLGLFIFGTPNPILWGLLAGALRFIPYVGAALGAVLPTLIAFAVSPGWIQPVFVLGWIVGCDLLLGQILEPLIFGDSTGVTPLALILSALFWGTLWGPAGLLLSTPIAICLLVIGRHVPNLGFLNILLGDEPALRPYQQIYRRLIRKGVPEASAIALAEIEEKGKEAGLDDSLGRMVALAEDDRSTDRLSAGQIDAIVEGTDLVLDFLEEKPDETASPSEAPAERGYASSLRPRPLVRCIGGRSQIDAAAAAVIAFALRQGGLDAVRVRNAESESPAEAVAFTVNLICYASHPSDAVRRYTSRKLRGAGKGSLRHAIVDYNVAASHLAGRVMVEGAETFVGDIASLCRLTMEAVSAISSLDQQLGRQSS